MQQVLPVRLVQRQQSLVRKVSLDRQVLPARKVQHLTSRDQPVRKGQQVRKDFRLMSLVQQVHLGLPVQSVQQVLGSTILRRPLLRRRTRSARVTLVSSLRSTLRLRLSSRFQPTRRTTLQ